MKLPSLLDHPASASHSSPKPIRLPRQRTAAVLLAILAGFVAHAQADPINVPNASFESPTSPVQTSKSPNILPGWIFNVQGGSEYGTMAVHSSFFTSSGASSGNNYATINNDYPGVTDTLSSAAPLTTIAPLTTYTLSVAIGNRNGTGLYQDPGNVSFSLLANGVPFASETIPNGTIPNGTFEDFTLTYAVPSTASIIGDNLTIQMATLPEQGSAYQAGFDNITLDAVAMDPPAVPEPSTCMLLACGVLILGWLVRRQKAAAQISISVASLVLTAAIAHATPGNIPNASFENPSTPTEGNSIPIPGWVFSIQGGYLYGTAPISQSFKSEGAASGNNYAFLFNDAAGATDTISSAASLGIIEPNTSYTLTVAVGNVGGSDSVSNHSPGNVSFSLLANGIAFATDTVPNGTVPDATFEDFSLTFQTPSFGSIIGESLGIQLASLPTSGPGSGPAFDNVTLDATSLAAAPEPATWALMASGLLTLCWLTRRKLALA